MNNISWSDKHTPIKKEEEIIQVVEKINNSEAYLKRLEEAYNLLDEEYISNPNNRLYNAKINLQSALMELN